MATTPDATSVFKKLNLSCKYSFNSHLPIHTPRTVYTISTSVDQLTCKAKIAHSMYSRPLIDTGSQICLISSSVYERLPKQYRNIYDTFIRVQTANGVLMRVRGTVRLPIQLGKCNFDQDFVIVDNLKHPVIIGLNLMKKEGINLNLGTNTLTVRDEDVPMSTISTVNEKGRLAQSIKVAPSTISFIYLKSPSSHFFNKSSPLMIESAPESFIANEPGLFLVNSVAKIHKNNGIPAILVNSTGRHFYLKQGHVLGQLTSIPDEKYECMHTSTPRQTDATHDELDPKFSIKNLKIDNPNVSAEDIESLKSLLEEFDDIFAKHSHDIGKAKDIKVNIPLKENKIISRPAYKIPLTAQPEVQKQIQQMLKYDIIEKANNSPWQFSLVTVPKKEKGLRICVDLRPLNQIVQFFSFPLSDLDKTLASLSKAKFMSSFDLNQAYWNLEVNEKDREKLTFVCDEGKFKFKRLPFGLNIAPSIFSQYLSGVLQGLDGIANYLDDVIAWSLTIEEHFAVLRALFTRLRESNLKLKFPKCSFFQQQLKYLGYVVTEHGLQPDPDKLEAIKNIPTPSTVKSTRSFLGAINFFRRFIPNYSRIAKPLFSLTKKNIKFHWTTDHDESFQTLKNILMSDTVLAFPDVTKKMALFTDASDTCIGACLTQPDEDGYFRPVYFLSHKLSNTMTRWSVTEKELYAIIYSLQKLRHIVYGTNLDIYTDHRPIVHLESSKLMNTKLQRWSLILNDYGAQVKYLRGASNHVADFLSRYALNTKSCSMINTNVTTKTRPPVDDSIPTDENDTDDPIWTDPLQIKDPAMFNISELQNNDPKCSEILHNLEKHPEKPSKFTIANDILYFLDDSERARLVLPQCLIKSAVKETHEGYFGAHLGKTKTYQTLCQNYYAPGLYAATFKHVAKCIPCATANTRQQKVPIQEFPLPPEPMHSVAIDTCGPFPTSHLGNKYVVTIIDLFTGYVEAYVTKDKTAASVADILVNDYFSRHSIPRILLSDNGSEYLNEVIKFITNTLKIHHIQSSTYNPRSNGKCERSHRLLSDTLIKLSRKDPLSWDTYVKNYVGAYNAAATSSGFSPFFLLYHRLPVYPLDTLLRPRDNYKGESFGPHLVEKMHKIFVRLRKQLKSEKTKRNAKINETTKPDEIDVGDAVFVRNNTRENKLSPKWYPTPYVVVKKTGPHSFRVQNMSNYKTYRHHARNLRLMSPNEEWFNAHRRVNAPQHDRRPQRRARQAAQTSSSSPSSSSSRSSSSSHSSSHDDHAEHSQVPPPINHPPPSPRDLSSTSSSSESQSPPRRNHSVSPSPTSASSSTSSKNRSSHSRSRSPIPRSQTSPPTGTTKSTSNRTPPSKPTLRSRSRSPITRVKSPPRPTLPIPQLAPPPQPPSPLSQPQPPRPQTPPQSMDTQMPTLPPQPPVPPVRAKRVRRTVPPSDRTLRSHTKRNKPESDSDEMDTEDIALSKRVKVNSLEMFISHLSPDQIKNLSDETVNSIIRHLTK